MKADVSVGHAMLDGGVIVDVGELAGSTKVDSDEVSDIFYSIPSLVDPNQPRQPTKKREREPSFHVIEREPLAGRRTLQPCSCKKSRSKRNSLIPRLLSISIVHRQTIFLLREKTIA